MKKRGRKSTSRNNRSTFFIGLILIIAAAVAVWLGSNDWNVKEAIGDLQGDSEKQPAEFQEVVPVPEHIEKETGEEKAHDRNGTPAEEGRKSSERDAGETGTDTEHTNKSNPTGYVEDQQLPNDPKYVDGVLIANKQYPLPKDFAPGESEEAREAFEEMAAAALTSGISLQAFSTYRSYDYQVTLYNRYVERDGQEAADRYSARPGYSEHQTGLAFDIGEVNHENYWATTAFSDTEAAKWLAANSYEYGFILRYPEGKEDVTGYMHEAWHYRYVGKDKAGQIFKRNITLEEYLGLR